MLWDIFTVFTRWRLWKGAVSERKGYWFLVFFNSLPWLAGVCVTFPDLGLRAGHSLAVTVIHQCHGLVNDPSAGHDGFPLTCKSNQKELWPNHVHSLTKTQKLGAPCSLYQMYSTTSARNLIPISAQLLHWHVLGFFFFQKSYKSLLNNHAIDCFTEAASWAFSF